MNPRTLASTIIWSFRNGPNPWKPTIPCLSMAMTQRSQLCLETPPQWFEMMHEIQTIPLQRVTFEISSISLQTVQHTHFAAQLHNAVTDGKVFNKSTTSSVMRLQQTANKTANCGSSGAKTRLKAVRVEPKDPKDWLNQGQVDEFQVWTGKIQIFAHVWLAIGV